MAAIPLDEQIVAILTAECTSDDAAAVVVLATAALKDMTDEADKADVASLSPLATSAQAMTLRRKGLDLRFEADRMEASLSALEARVADLRDAEQRTRQNAKRREVAIQRDALSADIARDYPRLVRELTVLAKRIHDTDVACKAVGLPESAEAAGRGIQGFSTGAGWIPRLAEMKVGMPASTWLAWEQTMDGWHWRGLAIPEPTVAEGAGE